MSVKLPNGVVLAIATAYGAVKTVTAVTNAAPPVATSTAHALTDGTFVEITSGWNRLNAAIVRLIGVAANTMNFEGQTTVDTTKYPAGTGVGSVRAITSFTQLAQITGLSSSGGEMQFANYSFLEEDFEREIPTEASPITLTAEIADDPTLPGYIALAAVAESRVAVGLKMTFPSGSIFLFNAIVSLGAIPKMNKGEIMTVTATFSLQGKPVRYAS